MLAQLFPYDPLVVLGYNAFFVALILLLIFLKKPTSELGRAFLFILIVTPVFLATLYITGYTLYKISTSATKGPIHWHADFLVYACGVKIDLLDPTGLSNKVGTPVVHEHGDGRIHIEGILNNLTEASLGGFFKAVGGSLTNESLSLPMNSGMVSMKNGDICPDGTEAELQVFLWETDKEGYARQRKLSEFSSYLMKGVELVPPGDCLVIEFGAKRDRTEYVCEQYTVAEKRGDIEILR